MAKHFLLYQTYRPTVMNTMLIPGLLPANETALLCNNISHWLDASLRINPVNKYVSWDNLTHWSRVRRICVSKLSIIGSDNGLSPDRRQAIIWTSAGILIIGTLGTNFNEILIEIHAFTFKNIHLKMASILSRPECVNSLRPANNQCQHGGVPGVQFMITLFWSLLIFVHQWWVINGLQKGLMPLDNIVFSYNPNFYWKKITFFFFNIWQKRWSIYSSPPWLPSKLCYTNNKLVRAGNVPHNTRSDTYLTEELGTNNRKENKAQKPKLLISIWKSYRQTELISQNITLNMIVICNK